jgi:hypothetical protein
VNVIGSLVYKEHLAMKEEINKHKWYESEKAGHDIGYSKALFDWIIKYKSEWLKKRKK